MPTTPAAGDQQAQGGLFAVVGRLLGAGAGTAAVDGAVVVQGGLIRSVDIPAVPARLPPRQVHAPFVAPGFIDLQVNGAFGFEVGPEAAALAALAAHLPTTGVTTFLPTLITRQEPDYAAAFAAFDTFAAAPRLMPGMPGGTAPRLRPGPATEAAPRLRPGPGAEAPPRLPTEAAPRLRPGAEAAPRLPTEAAPRLRPGPAAEAAPRLRPGPGGGAGAPRLRPEAVAPELVMADAPGLHLEGPLLAASRHGAHDRATIEAADAALVERLADPCRVRLVTLAPERAGAIALTARLRARGVVVALGHTDATFEAFTAAVDAGATLATHVFNAMSPFHHRAPGAPGAALTDDRVVALLIADGVHTHPAVFKLAVRAKGIDGLALATDAAPGAGLGPGRSVLGGQIVIIDQHSARLVDGTLAGSTLTLDCAVRNAVAFAGLTAAEAVHLATAVPARVLGLGDRGRLAVGSRADLTLLDAALNVQATYVCGHLAYRAPERP